ncbi:MAG: hypothetical protein RLZZ241_2531, partial [Bacteroidota bacterium]
METTRAQDSTNAIERMYITMRHLLNRGFYKPMGVSGEMLRSALLQLRPEIYGSIAEDKAELDGLIYVLERLPEGIEQCRFINLTSDEGYGKSHFKPIIPPKRRRNCYRIDADQMNIEITRGRSDIYDILTHLTFLFIEAEKIGRRVLIEEGQKTIRDWNKLESALAKAELSLEEREVALIHASSILNRSYEEVERIYQKLTLKSDPQRFLKIVYWLGKLAIEELTLGEKRTITFSAMLRDRLGHHVHGERWANSIKQALHGKSLLNRPIHIISSNMHSVVNSLFAQAALKKEFGQKEPLEIFEALSSSENGKLRDKVLQLARKHGMLEIDDLSGTNIDVQIFDTAFLTKAVTEYTLATTPAEKKPVLLVMDYAFGEQAFESIDELLKPFKMDGKKHFLDVASISIMGKAGILAGDKGDLMIPTAHIFEGTADNYPFYNALSGADFEGNGLRVYEGTMVTVLGTSLQNKDILEFFQKSTWQAIGLEMEGVHYQKAIQSA